MPGQNLCATACRGLRLEVCMPVQVNAQLSGWRTSKGLLLREAATASVDYTPALAKYVFLTITDNEAEL